MFNGIQFFGMNQVSGSTPFTPWLYIGGRTTGGFNFRKLDYPTATSPSITWSKNITGGADGTDVMRCIRVDENGDIYNSVNKVATYDTFFKHDTDGTLLWSHDIGLSRGCAVDSSGNPWAVTDVGPTSSVPEVRKYDTDGTLLFAVPVPNGDIGISLAGDMNGNMYLGKVYGTDSISLVKFDSSGNVLWQNGSFAGNISSLSVPYSSGYVLVGAYRVGGLSLFKIDSSGSFVWSKDSGATIGWYGPNGISVDSDSGYIWTTSDSTPNLRKYNEAGTLLYSYSQSCSICRSGANSIDEAGQVFTSMQKYTDGQITKYTNANPPVNVWKKTNLGGTNDFAVLNMAIYPLPFRRKIT